MKDKPFALVGVNVNNYEPEKLKAVMVKENMNWRSTADDGSIAEKWNSPGTPVYYVLDPQGIIRHKWVGNPGEKALDASLEKLIQETEKKSPGSK
ncbi:MAG: TlpA family protein disulfide reductase [Planctomycetales bacterium]|nr:TlpA family protein disulfide reductase [Planctomycetales bacterium]